MLRPVKPRESRLRLYGEPVIAAVRFRWAVQGTRCGRLLAAALLLKIAPATIGRRFKADRARLDPRGRSHTGPGTLLQDSIPIRTWAE